MKNPDVTISPVPCGRVLNASNPGLSWVCSAETAGCIRCANCRPLGDRLADLGYEMSEFSSEWRVTLVWNLTLGALLCVAEIREFNRIYGTT